MAESGSEKRFGSNGIRLSSREWVAVAGIMAALAWMIPWTWKRLERFEPGPDYRVPYALSEDYWHYDRFCRWASARDAVLVVGDSVIWGEYVSPQGSLSSHLNRLSPGTRFINLGANGTHPAALSGLVATYGRAIRGRRVLLHCNPLWMSSPRHDLQSAKEFRFNHPRLVPQFWPRIPCYKEPCGGRIGIAINRAVPSLGWPNHLKIIAFDGLDLVPWSLENPTRNPLKPIDFRILEPEQDVEDRHALVPWYESGMKPTAFEWVKPDTSLQWRLFKRTVETLRARGNSVFVVVGPFNRHMIAEEARPDFEALQEAMEAWLEVQAVPHLMAPTLPRELYADASHPLSDGYALLARWILDSEAFAAWQR